MKRLQIWDNLEETYVTDELFLMKHAGLKIEDGFQCLGLKNDGTPLVFDKKGAYGELDTNRFVSIFNTVDEQHFLRIG